MSETVLTGKKSIITRPYSNQELEILHYNFFKKLFIGNIQVMHDCGHIYFCKKNGLKEKTIISTDGKDIGKCSVCWKLTKTPKKYRFRAQNLIANYQNISSKQLPQDYLDLELEKDFYVWLYKEYNL
jgi:hypothetical protein